MCNEFTTTTVPQAMVQAKATRAWVIIKYVKLKEILMSLDPIIIIKKWNYVTRPLLKSWRRHDTVRRKKWKWENVVWWCKTPVNTLQRDIITTTISNHLTEINHVCSVVWCTMTAGNVGSVDDDIRGLRLDQMWWMVDVFKWKEKCYQLCLVPSWFHSLQVIIDNAP